MTSEIVAPFLSEQLFTLFFLSFVVYEFHVKFKIHIVQSNVELVLNLDCLHT